MTEMPSVVYIENDPTLYEVIALALTKMGGFDAKGFADVHAALEYVGDAHPSAVFIDCANVDGKTAAFLKALRADPACRNIPVILASDRKGIHQIRRYKAIGATTVIPTPINPFSLSQTIRDIISVDTAANFDLMPSVGGQVGLIEHAGVAR